MCVLGVNTLVHTSGCVCVHMCIPMCLSLHVHVCVCVCVCTRTSCDFLCT